ncbi:unnamed protein product [Adineta steineri]|uniref:G-protein coupled receptors family 1 profile domain-containing protein n=1 Tax=Adineta steineri TaxID=433720 RepID=A0A818YIB7_9BILA|nr:unnamed protein product [Adineta steineri]
MNSTTTVINSFSPFHPIQFSILLFLIICSIPCFIFVFYQILSTRTLYRALNSHVLILLLISNSIQTVTDIPLRLSYYYTGKILPFTVSYCYFYYFIDLYLFTTCFLLLAWASFERHILIFHSQIFNRFRTRLIGHYIPLSFCIIYPLLYYIIFIFFYPCENTYDPVNSYCIAICYLFASPVMALYEQIVHGFALVFLIFIFNLSLFFRILHQKNRNMAIQLFSVCFLFFLTNGGYFLILLGQGLWDPNFGNSLMAWVFPLSFYPKEKIKRFIRCQFHTAIMPLTVTVPQQIAMTNRRRRDL